MSVEDWARREAERLATHDFEELSAHDRGVMVGTAQGIVHAFSALLSDEAVEAAARAMWDYQPEKHEKSWEYGPMRAALQAAIAAVTEGDTVIIEAPVDVSERVQRGVVGGVSIAEGDTE